MQEDFSSTLILNVNIQIWYEHANHTNVVYETVVPLLPGSCNVDFVWSIILILHTKQHKTSKTIPSSKTDNMRTCDVHSNQRQKHAQCDHVSDR